MTQIPGLITAHKAGGAVPARRIVKHGAARGEAVLATAAADKSIGVSSSLAGVAGKTFDVTRGGIAPVEYGGTVAAGDPLTSDANGRAVVAAPAGGANVRIVGFAEEPGVAGDIGSVHLSPGVMQG